MTYLFNDDGILLLEYDVIYTCDSLVVLTQHLHLYGVCVSILCSILCA